MGERKVTKNVKQYKLSAFPARIRPDIRRVPYPSKNGGNHKAEKSKAGRYAALNAEFIF